MNRLIQLAYELSRKMEKNAGAEAVRMHKRSDFKLRIIGTAIGILVVLLVAIWINHRP